MQLELSPPSPIYSISELTRKIKLRLENEFLNVWVVGEISNLKQPASGHLYFTLKDARTQLPAMMFRSARRFLKFRPAAGMEVLARGRVTVYEPRGSYQLQVESLEPRGKGALQIAFEQLKEKLAKEGLFAPERKRPLPLLPQRLGIVTSPTGAAIRDLCRILYRRFPNLEVLLYPAQVQGHLAAAEIAQGIRVLNRVGRFDVLIVGRGGGSLEDLWPFNEESVARAITASRIPVISAVGHEADFTVADLVADVRAPTPSAAAEMVVAKKDYFLERVAMLEKRLNEALGYRLSRMRSIVDGLADHQAFLAVRHSVVSSSQRLDELSFRAHSLVDRTMSALRSQLIATSRDLESVRMDRRVAESQTRLAHSISLLASAQRTGLRFAGDRLARATAKLDALSPLGVLARGYSLTWDADGRLVRDATAVAPGEAVRVTLERGELDCRVEGRRAKREGP